MRIPINLASEPFRRDRSILVASAAGCIVLVLTLIGLGLSIASSRSRAAEARGIVERLNRQITALNVEQAKLDATLRQPENADVIERSLLLNTLISRKSISWTRIFADLEKVMPHDVQLIYVRLPQINSNNQVMLDMVVGAQSAEPVVRFMRKLEASPLFGPNTLLTMQPPTQNEKLWRYRVTVSYAQKL